MKTVLVVALIALFGVGAWTLGSQPLNTSSPGSLLSTLVETYRPPSISPEAEAALRRVTVEVVPQRCSFFGVVCSEVGQGTGFVVGPSLILTADHVAQPGGATVGPLSIRLGAEWRSATLVRADHGLDLALLKAENAPSPSLQVRSEDSPPQRGDYVWVLCYGDTVSRRLRIGLGFALRSYAIPEGEALTGRLEPGCSGAAVVDRNGVVVGVVYGGAPAGKGAGRAIDLVLGNVAAMVPLTSRNVTGLAAPIPIGIR